jgi:hypothetical protein
MKKVNKKNNILGTLKRMRKGKRSYSNMGNNPNIFESSDKEGGEKEELEMNNISAFTRSRLEAAPSELENNTKNNEVGIVSYESNEEDEEETKDEDEDEFNNTSYDQDIVMETTNRDVGLYDGGIVTELSADGKDMEEDIIVYNKEVSDMGNVKIKKTTKIKSDKDCCSSCCPCFCFKKNKNKNKNKTNIQIHTVYKTTKRSFTIMENGNVEFGYLMKKNIYKHSNLVCRRCQMKMSNKKGKIKMYWVKIETGGMNNIHKNKVLMCNECWESIFIN